MSVFTKDLDLIFAFNKLDGSREFKSKSNTSIMSYKTSHKKSQTNSFKQCSFFFSVHEVCDGVWVPSDLSIDERRKWFSRLKSKLIFKRYLFRFSTDFKVLTTFYWKWRLSFKGFRHCLVGAILFFVNYHRIFFRLQLWWETTRKYQKKKKKKKIFTIFFF